jgi:hypothetical protein
MHGIVRVVRAHIMRGIVRAVRDHAMRGIVRVVRAYVMHDIVLRVRTFCAALCVFVFAELFFTITKFFPFRFLSLKRFMCLGKKFLRGFRFVFHMKNFWNF